MRIVNDAKIYRNSTKNSKPNDDVQYRFDCMSVDNNIYMEKYNFYPVHVCFVDGQIRWAIILLPNFPKY